LIDSLVLFYVQFKLDASEVENSASVGSKNHICIS
jgi:hypothetical protein